MVIREFENDLFTEWKALYSTPFVKDGLVCEEFWNDANRKILFVLKEAHGSEDFDLRAFLQEGGKTETWQTLSEWAYGLLHLEDNCDWKAVHTLCQQVGRKDILKKLCVVNINKEPGGSATNNKKLKSNFYTKDKNYLAKQLRLYEGTDIVICCGSVITPLFVTLFEDLYDYKYKCGEGTIFDGIWTYQIKNGPLLISFYHPQQRRYSKELLYNKLLNAVRAKIS